MSKPLRGWWSWRKSWGNGGRGLDIEVAYVIASGWWTRARDFPFSGIYICKQAFRDQYSSHIDYLRHQSYSPSPPSNMQDSPAFITMLPTFCYLFLLCHHILVLSLGIYDTCKVSFEYNFRTLVWRGVFRYLT